MNGAATARGALGAQALPTHPTPERLRQKRNTATEAKAPPSSIPNGVTGAAGAHLPSVRVIHEKCKAQNFIGTITIIAPSAEDTGLIKALVTVVSTL